MTLRSGRFFFALSLLATVPLFAQFEFPNSQQEAQKPPVATPAPAQPAPQPQPVERPEAATQRPVQATPPHAQVKLPAGVPQVPMELSTRVWGNTIRYFDTGTGPTTVVLLHGLGSAKEDWFFLLPYLAPQLRVIALDQIGFGHSDKPLLNYRIGTYTDFLDEFLAQLKIDRATLVGASMGGWIASLYAVQHPARVEKLILIDTGGYSMPKDADPLALNALNPSTREATRKLMAFVMAPGYPVSDQLVDMAYLRRMTAGDGYTINQLSASMLRNEDVMDENFSKITVPTLLVWGAKDQFLSLDVARRVQTQIAGSKLIPIENAGHMPQLDHAAEVGRAISDFVAGR